jgi:hypothetical protein
MGISPKSSNNMVKRAWKHLVLRYHPDKPGGDKAKFIDLKSAKELIDSDPDRVKLTDAEEKRRIKVESLCDVPFDSRNGSESMKSITNMDDCIDADDFTCFDGCFETSCRERSLTHPFTRCYFPKDVECRRLHEFLKKNVNCLKLETTIATDAQDYSTAVRIDEEILKCNDVLSILSKEDHGLQSERCGVRLMQFKESNVKLKLCEHV